MKNKEGDLKVWWIPQLPMNAFYKPVANIEQAKLLLETLAEYDIFQYENNVKGDYCNTGGLVVFEGGEWNDWHSEYGDDIDEIMRGNDD